MLQEIRRTNCKVLITCKYSVCMHAWVFVCLFVRLFGHFHCLNLMFMSEPYLWRILLSLFFFDSRFVLSVSWLLLTYRWLWLSPQPLIWTSTVTLELSPELATRQTWHPQVRGDIILYSTHSRCECSELDDVYQHRFTNCACLISHCRSRTVDTMSM